MSAYYKSILVLGSIPGVFLVAFFVLRYLRVTGQDSIFESDWAIARHLGIIAAMLLGGSLLLTFVDLAFERIVKRTGRRK